MSVSKRILFGDDPAYDQARREIVENVSQTIDAYKFSIPTRRRNRLGSGPYWDATWPSCVHSAADELGIRTIGVNSRICTKTQEEADAILAQAALIHKKRIAERSVLFRSIPQGKA
jgi:hypothetical protein